jgi:hypothetical protein
MNLLPSDLFSLEVITIISCSVPAVDGPAIDTDFPLLIAPPDVLSLLERLPGLTGFSGKSESESSAELDAGLLHGFTFLLSEADEELGEE